MKDNNLSNGLIFCNVCWMEHYDDINKKEPPARFGGGFVEQHGYGYERNNFSVFTVTGKDGKTKKRVKGFFETGHKNNQDETRKRLDLGKINPTFRNRDEIDHVLIIFCAKNPKTNKTCIVGWYDNALLIDKPGDGYTESPNCYADAEDICLLPINERTFEVPRSTANPLHFGFGQCNYWYANEPQAQDFVNEVLDYIEKKQNNKYQHLRKIIFVDPVKIDLNNIEKFKNEEDSKEE